LTFSTIVGNFVYLGLPTFPLLEAVRR
jgi:hypothetical protein